MVSCPRAVTGRDAGRLGNPRTIPQEQAGSWIEVTEEADPGAAADGPHEAWLCQLQRPSRVRLLLSWVDYEAVGSPRMLQLLEVERVRYVTAQPLTLARRATP